VGNTCIITLRIRFCIITTATCLGLFVALLTSNPLRVKLTQAEHELTSPIVDDCKLLTSHRRMTIGAWLKSLTTPTWDWWSRDIGRRGFGEKRFRREEVSERRGFGEKRFRREEVSERRGFGEKRFRREEVSERRGFGEKRFRREEVLERSMLI